jgi:hypothetical protein
MLAYHPFTWIGFIFIGLFAYLVIRTKADLPTFITSLNSFGAQPVGIAVLSIGCVMLILCKQYDLDSTIAGGIVGCGINMLTNQFSKHPPTNPDDISTVAKDSAPKQ